MDPYDENDAEAFEVNQLGFDADIDWGEEPELACGIENPEVCESCQ